MTCLNTKVDIFPLKAPVELPYINILERYLNSLKFGYITIGGCFRKHLFKGTKDKIH